MEDGVKYLIIIPVYNEAKNIQKVISNFINNYPQHDYIIVDDGSTDATEKSVGRTDIRH